MEAALLWTEISPQTRMRRCCRGPLGSVLGSSRGQVRRRHHEGLGVSRVWPVTGSTEMFWGNCVTVHYSRESECGAREGSHCGALPASLWPQPFPPQVAFPGHGWSLGRGCRRPGRKVDCLPALPLWPGAHTPRKEDFVQDPAFRSTCSRFTQPGKCNVHLTGEETEAERGSGFCWADGCWWESHVLTLFLSPGPGLAACPHIVH